MQITRTTPLRRMILQFRHIFFTLANTFISLSSPRSHRAFTARHRRRRGVCSPSSAARPLNHFALNVIRARERSYGVSSTVTLSPGRIFM